MTALKKTPPSQNSAYKLAAAALRAKVTYKASPLVGEVKPSQRRVWVILSDKLISRNRQTLKRNWWRSMDKMTTFTCW